MHDWEEGIYQEMSDNLWIRASTTLASTPNSSARSRYDNPFRAAPFPFRLDCKGAMGKRYESEVRDDLQELTGDDVERGNAASRISESLLICSAVKAARYR